VVSASNVTAAGKRDLNASLAVAQDHSSSQTLSAMHATALEPSMENHAIAVNPGYTHAEKLFLAGHVMVMVVGSLRVISAVEQVSFQRQTIAE
jgi:hypothetical protein